MSEYDVVIAGASVAGASMAVALSASGLRIALVDKAQFPRRKPCGEGLSCGGLAMLEKLGLKRALERAPHCRFSGYAVERGGRRSRIGMNDARLCGMGIERETLDELLWSAAGKSGVVERIRGRLRFVTETRGGITVSCSGAALRGRLLVIADGARSDLAAQLGVSARVSGPRRYGYSMLLEGSFDAAPQCVTIAVRPGVQAFCTPVGEARLNVSFLSSGSLRELSRTGHAQNELLDYSCRAAGFSRAKLVIGQGAGPIGAQLRAATVGERVLLIGDACEQLDPAGGMGMTHALLSSRYAADAVEAILVRGAASSEALLHYATRREQAVRPLRGFTRLAVFSLATLRPQAVAALLERSPLSSALSSAVHAAAERPGESRGICGALLYRAGRDSFRELAPPSPQVQPRRGVTAEQR